jgi:HAD superfamily hydrolase (TIGR01509 family)
MNMGLIFDCDGVVVDLEIDRHRRAFNQVWHELGIAWEWSAENYAKALAVSGGRERLARLQNDPGFRQAFVVPDDPREWELIVANWHRRKTEIYVEMVHDGVVPRSGVRRLAREALRQGWRVGIASAGARASVNAVVRAALGPELSRRLTVVTGEDVSTKKPAPDVYLATSDAMGLRPGDCVVIEDTRNGLMAATAAGMTCLITPTGLSLHDDFSEADLVVRELGEPGMTAQITLGGRCGGLARSHLTLGDLTDLMSVSQSTT